MSSHVNNLHRPVRYWPTTASAPKDHGETCGLDLAQSISTDLTYPFSWQPLMLLDDALVGLVSLVRPPIMADQKDQNLPLNFVYPASVSPSG